MTKYSDMLLAMVGLEAVEHQVKILEDGQLKPWTSP
jgi:hypothetical protein